MPFPTTQLVNLPACSPDCPFNAERQLSREAVNTNFKVIGLTRLGIKAKSTALEADVLTTRPSELSKPPSVQHLNTNTIISASSFTVMMVKFLPKCL